MWVASHLQSVQKCSEITVVMAVKCADLWGMMRSLSLSLPLWSGKMWITLRNESRAPPSSPLWHHSSDALLYLLAPSPSRHLVPIPTEIAISPVAWPSVVSKNWVAHFQVIGLAEEVYPGARPGLFLFVLLIYRTDIPVEHENMRPTTGHWPWLLEEKGERSGWQGHVLRVRGYR